MRDTYSIDLAIVIHIVGTFSATEHVNRVVVTPHQSVGNEVAHLLARMVGRGVWGYALLMQAKFSNGSLEDAWGRIPMGTIPPAPEHLNLPFEQERKRGSFLVYR